MHALVTGGGGFLGLYISERLVERGDTVRVLCRGRYARLHELGVDCRQADIRDVDAVRDACLRYPIDPDRVYVQGISQTGYWAWWLAQYAPDRWAAVAPVGSVTFHVRKLLPNVINVPLFVLHGTDGRFMQVAMQEQFRELREAAAERGEAAVATGDDTIETV